MVINMRIILEVIVIIGFANAGVIQNIEPDLDAPKDLANDIAKELDPYTARTPVNRDTPTKPIHPTMPGMATVISPPRVTPTTPKIFKSLDSEDDAEVFKERLSENMKEEFDKLRKDKNLDGISRLPGVDVKRILTEFEKLAPKIKTAIEKHNFTDVSPGDLHNLPDNFCQVMSREAQKGLVDLTGVKAEIICKRVLMSGNAKEAECIMKYVKCGRESFDQLNMPEKGSDAIKRTLVESEKKRKSPDQWDRQTWTFMIKDLEGKGLDRKDIMNMGSDVVQDMVKGKQLTTDSIKKLDREAQDALKKKIKKEVGPAGSMTSTSLGDIAGVVCDVFDEMDFDQIPPEVMKAASSRMRDAACPEKRKRVALGRAVLNAVGDGWNFNSSNVRNTLPFIQSDERYLKKVDPDLLLDSLNEDSADGFLDDRGKAKITKRLMDNDRFKKGTVGAADLVKAEKVFDKLPSTFLEKLPPTTVQDALGSFAKNKKMKRGMCKILMKKMGKKVSELTSSDISKYGEVLRGLEAKELKDMPAGLLLDPIARQELGRIDFEDGQALSLLQQYRGASIQKMGTSVFAVGGLSRFINEELLVDQLDPSDIDVSDEGVDYNVELPRSTSAALLDLIMNGTLGKPSPESTNYTAHVIKHIARPLARGGSVDILQNLPEGTDFVSSAEAILAYETEMTASQLQTIAKKYDRFANLSNAEEAAKVTLDDVTAMRGVLKMINMSSLERLRTDVRGEAAKKMAASSMDMVSKKAGKEIVQFVLKNTLRDDTGQITDRTKSKVLDDNDMREMENLYHFMDEDTVTRMDDESVVKHLAEISQAPYDEGLCQAYLRRVKQLYGVQLPLNESLLADLGGLLQCAEYGDIENIPTETLQAVGMVMLDTLDTQQANRKKRDDHGFKDELDEGQRERMRQNRRKLVKRILDAADEDFISDSRRRRSTTGLQCGDLKALGDSAVDVDASRLQTMTTEEFNDCAETLGALSGWDSGQLSALTSQAKAAWGTDLAIWTAEQTRQAGSIIAGLTTTEITNLPLSSVDVMSSLGKHNDFTSQQLTAGFNRWLSVSRFGHPSVVSGVDIAVIGNFACGAMPSQINTFSAVVYKEAASSVGALSSCTPAQLEAYAGKAREAFGNYPEQWSLSHTMAAGSVVGGLDKTEISSLSTNQVATLTPSTIQSMPADAFASFTEAQLATFSSTQASAVTSEQKATLGGEQRKALGEASAAEESATLSFLLLASLLATFIM